MEFKVGDKVKLKRSNPMSTYLIMSINRNNWYDGRNVYHLREIEPFIKDIYDSPSEFFFLDDIEMDWETRDKKIDIIINE